MRLAEPAAGTRLSSKLLTTAAGVVAMPAYDRSACEVGIVHLGAGAFHRAHQAVFIDDILGAGERNWAICGVSLRSPAVRDAIVDQDYLYTLAILDRQTAYRVVGSIKEILVAPAQRRQILERLASPATQIVSLTVTEKGYCLSRSGDLDIDHPDIASDLLSPRQPGSAIGYLVEGLRLRRASGVASFTVMSCDNLSENGRRLSRAVCQFAEQVDPGLASWIRVETRFPCTMVDSITPATDDRLRELVDNGTGLVDAWPIQREAFSQWVIEDNFVAARPAFERAGVTMTDDVAPYEQAKLRLLNGAHSSLAYLGLLAGHETVCDAMGDQFLMAHIDAMMREEIAPSLGDTPMDLDAYIASILRRFSNASIIHLLSQIAWDGSQKLPFRILMTIKDNLQAGRPVEKLCLTIAAWFHFLRRAAGTSMEIVDPLANLLKDIGGDCDGDPVEDVSKFSVIESVFDETLRQDPSLWRELAGAYERIESLGVSGAVSNTAGVCRNSR